MGFRSGITVGLWWDYLPVISTFDGGKVAKYGQTTTKTNQQGYGSINHHVSIKPHGQPSLIDG